VLIGDIVGVPVGDLVHGGGPAGMVLVGLYILYILIIRLAAAGLGAAHPQGGTGRHYPGHHVEEAGGPGPVPPLFLMVAVLGSIFAGVASPTEAAAVGAVGATLLTIANKKFSMKILQEVMHSTMQLTCMVFIILVGAAPSGWSSAGWAATPGAEFLGSLAHKYITASGSCWPSSWG
jgi:TRAP-type mannitol/chloroaromatic compound transport system permease large subunit